MRVTKKDLQSARVAVAKKNLVKARKELNEAITRKAKERLNLLNDIVNFAYEYGENETKTLFQQAFKKAIGDDLVESLTEEE